MKRMETFNCDIFSAGHFKSILSVEKISTLRVDLLNCLIGDYMRRRGLKRYQRYFRRNPSRSCPHCGGKGLVFSGICSFCHGEGHTERKSWVNRRCNPCIPCALALAMLRRRRNPEPWLDYVDSDDIDMNHLADDDAMPEIWKRNPDPGLICIECQETCGIDKDCDLYQGAPHTHLAGGHDNYPVCKSCLIKLYERHRPGNLKWIKTCQEGCGFCNIT